MSQGMSAAVCSARELEEKPGICRTFANNTETLVGAISLATSIRRTLTGDEANVKSSGELTVDSLADEAQDQRNKIFELMNILDGIRAAL